MSLLRNQPVNPLNNSAVVAEQAQPVEVIHQEIPVETAPVAYQNPSVASTGYVQPVQSTAVAPAATHFPAQSFGAPQAQFNDGLDDDVELGFGALPRIKLDKGFFYMDEARFGESFECNIFQKRSQFVYRSKKGEGKDVEVAYSYEDFHVNPNALSSKGEPIASLWNRWKGMGHEPAVSENYEVAVMILSGEAEGQVVILSVSPGSKTRFDGYLKVTKMSKGLRLNQVVTKVSVGALLKGKDNITWNPWNFEYVRPYQPAAQAA